VRLRCCGAGAGGRYPLFGRESTVGKVIGTVTAVVAGAIFSIFASVMGNGFQGILEARKERKEKEEAAKQKLQAAAQAGSTLQRGSIMRDGSFRLSNAPTLVGDMPHGWTAKNAQAALRSVKIPKTCQGKVYKLLHSKTKVARKLDVALSAIVFLAVLCLMLHTVPSIMGNIHAARLLNGLEVLFVFVFTLEFLLRLWSTVGVDRQFWGWQGKLRYLWTFDAVVDLLSVLPWYIDISLHGWPGTSTAFIRVVRVVRMFKVDK
jgi:hypothetical protein